MTTALEILSTGEIKDRLSRLRMALAGGHVDDAHALFVDLHRDVNAGVEATEAVLLQNALAWNEEEQRTATRIHRTLARLSDSGQEIASACFRHFPPGDPATLDVIAMAIVQWSNAAKWELISARTEDRRRFRELHLLYSHATRCKGELIVRPLLVQGESIEASIESLYVRTLLLKRLSSGNLSPQQAEILDSWLWAWMPSMWLSHEKPEGELALCINTASEGGLDFRPGDRGTPLWLKVSPLHRYLETAIASLQQGDLFPGKGLSARFRVEEHASVLDLLQREFQRIEEGAHEGRSARNAAFGMLVDIHIGMYDVMQRGFVPPAAEGTKTIVPVSSALRGERADSRGADAGYGKSQGERAMQARLQDQNETGLGLVASKEIMNKLHVGDLVGVRLDPAAPCVLGEVVRMFAVGSDDDVLAGVRLFAREALPMVFQRIDARNLPATDVAALFIPGGDYCGRGDSLVVNDAGFHPADILYTVDDGERFRLRTNRVRHKGRGWLLVGFEMLVGDQAPAAQASITPPTPVGETLTLVDMR